MTSRAPIPDPDALLVRQQGPLTGTFVATTEVDMYGHTGHELTLEVTAAGAGPIVEVEIQWEVQRRSGAAYAPVLYETEDSGTPGIVDVDPYTVRDDWTGLTPPFSRSYVLPRRTSGQIRALIRASDGDPTDSEVAAYITRFGYLGG